MDEAKKQELLTGFSAEVYGKDEKDEEAEKKRKAELKAAKEAKEKANPFLGRYENKPGEPKAVEPGTALEDVSPERISPEGAVDHLVRNNDGKLVPNEKINLRVATKSRRYSNARVN